MSPAEGDPVHSRVFGKAVGKVLLSDIVAKGLLAAAAVILIRQLPPSEYALLTLCLSLSAFVSQIISSCFNRLQVLARDSGRNPNKLLMHVFYQVVLCFGFSSFYLPFLNIGEAAFWLTIILSVSMVLCEFAKTIYQSGLQFLRYSVTETTRSALILVPIGILVWGLNFKLTAATALAVQALAGIVVFLPILFVAVASLRNSLSLSSRDSAHSSTDRGFAWVFGYSILVAALLQVDVVVLRSLSQEKELAAFGAAYRYYAILLVLLNAIQVVLFPSLLRATDLGERRRLFRKLRKWLILFAGCILVLILNADWLLPAVDGGKYRESIPVFRILCLSALVSFACSPYANVLMQQGEHRFLFITAFLGLLLHTLLSVTMTLQFGAFGAAIADLFGIGSVNFALYLRGSLGMSRAELAVDGPTKADI